jgi:hypothetical protein
MELFNGGMFRKQPAAASLSANDFENEPSFVEMRDPDAPPGRVPHLRV